MKTRRENTSFYAGPNRSVSVSVEIDIPTQCPVCNHLLTPGLLGQSFIPEKCELQLAYQCSNQDCRAYFITYHRGPTPQEITLSKVEPPDLKAEGFPTSIQSISSSFVSIYAEAHEANERGLRQIAGPGYRKAFEFLIKDYALSKSAPEEHELIQKVFAGDVVSKYIPDARIQAVAKRALWIGNDETHYMRKWRDKDITDLINLIKLTVHWIEIEYESKEYITEMPEGKGRAPVV